jgi:phosphohistidine phosphatase
MRVYLVQHAEAEPEERDPRRPLSEKGRRDAERVAKFLGSLGLEVSAIFHSGKLRAQQTAEVLASAVKTERGVQATEALAPLDDPKVWAERLREEDRDLILVGHLPHLAKLAGTLLACDPGTLEFKQGGVFCLERSEGRWQLRWAILPELVG